MTVTVTEKPESRVLVASRDGKSSTLDLTLIVRGTDSETIAKSNASAWAPDVWGSGLPYLWKQSVSVQPQYINGTDSIWEAVIHYDTSGPEPLAAEDSFEFDTTGGTQHITQSLSSVSRYPVSAPDFEGAIGVSDSGVDGVDITVPQLQFSETHFYAEISPAYKVLLANLTGTMNSAAFRGWAAGEVLFLGASAHRQDSRFQTPWQVVYRFAVSRSRSNFMVGDIAVTTKLGWDYMWVRYGSEVDSTANAIVKRPASVHIERVYEFGNFSLLGIGT